MITFDDAVRKARAQKKDIDMVVEYSKAYVFSSSNDEGTKGGINRAPVVVMKKDGQIVDMITFVNGGTGKEMGVRNI